MMMKKMGSFLLLALCSATTVYAAGDKWQIKDFGTTDPEKLRQYASNSPNTSIKERIYSYLAENAPNTAPGMHARAWMEGFNGADDEKSNQEQLRLYQRCIAFKSDYAPCRFNLAATYTRLKDTDKALEARLQLLQINPNYDDKLVIYHAYSDLRDKKSDAAGAEAC